MENKLIKSLSGMRGILRNKDFDTLTRKEVNDLLIAFFVYLNIDKNDFPKIVVGRDGRLSGNIVSEWVIQTLSNFKIEIVDIGYTTTPTIAIATKHMGAKAGIMITASHNPEEWNGIKLFNSKGEGLAAEDWQQVFDLSALKKQQEYNSKLAKYSKYDYKKCIQEHIKKILNLPIIEAHQKSIRNANFKIAIDGVNSTGGIALKMLAEKLGIIDIIAINSDLNKHFQRNPEPTNENLTLLCDTIIKNKCNIGFATDPDADRLAVVDERGIPWGEEYTLIACSDFVLASLSIKMQKMSIVSNLSSSMINKQIAQKYHAAYYSSPVGEANVIKKMKETEAIIGGEGNGGVIYPELNYCRDSLVAAAIILASLSKQKVKASELRSNYPSYNFVKQKLPYKTVDDYKDSLYSFLPKNKIDSLKERKLINDVNFEDGIKLFFENGWIHIRKSNTEPIIRICSEYKDKDKFDKIMKDLTYAGLV